MRRCFLFLLLFSSLLFLVSCQTKAIEAEEVDLAPIINPVLQMRPDNSQLKIITDVVDVYDVVENSTQYLMAWQLWESYADALENTIADINVYLGQ